MNASQQNEAKFFTIAKLLKKLKKTKYYNKFEKRSFC